MDAAYVGRGTLVFDSSALKEGPVPPKVLKTESEIIACLQPLQSKHVPLTLFFPQSGKRFQTYVLDLNADEGWLTVDELIPRDGERYLREGARFQVEAFHDGVRLNWENTDPTYHKDTEDGPCHWIAVPERLTYHQRRNAFRVSVTGQGVRARLTDTQHRIFESGELIDLSATGCGLRLQGENSLLQPGARYNELLIELPSGSLYSSVELRHVRYDARLNRAFCGFRFYEMPAASRRQIEKFVNQLQRTGRRSRFFNLF